jgi:predicted dehydrogenase
MLGIAVVGAGFMGQLHARTVAESDQALLAGIVDIDEEAGRSAATRFGTAYFHRVEESLQDATIEAYIVAVPDKLHTEVSCKILLAGRPVLLEKPLAHTLEDARKIVEASRTGRGRLLVGHILRFDPRYAGAAAAVGDGRIGAPIHAMAGRISSRIVGTRMNGSSSVLFYLGVHDADAIQWVTGRRIVRVYARSVSKLMPSLGVQSEDAVVSVVDFEDGTVGQLFNGWTRREDDPVDIDGRLEVFGTMGHVEVDVRDHGLKIYGEGRIEAPDGLHWPDVNGRVRGDLAAEVAHFARSVISGDEFVLSPEEAMRAVAVNDAALRSLASGVPEDVELV